MAGKSSPTYWSQPNQQVVRDGEPVGIIDSGPDPQADDDDEAAAKKRTKRQAG